MARWCRPHDYSDGLDIDQTGLFEDAKVDARWAEMRRQNDRERDWHGRMERMFPPRKLNAHQRGR